MPLVVIDANVFVSYLTGRDEKQYAAAEDLLLKAEDANLLAILPQFVVFEIAYVMQSVYDVKGAHLASMIHDIVTFPGVQLSNDLPWKTLFGIWPDVLPDLADASIVAVAIRNQYDAVATFDRKLAGKLGSFGLKSYF